MDRFVIGFIKSSLVWLGAGVLLGLGMAVLPGEMAVYRPAHMHANLLGFVSMMIFGVAYHVIPRFTGQPLHSRTLPQLHLWLANTGLAVMIIGWFLRVAAPGAAAVLVPAGGVLSAVGTAFFIYNLWRTLNRVVAPAQAAPGIPVFRFSSGNPAGR
jgi:heme/copper-type cytochrome/quinol oxidase subunit 1